MGPYKSSKRTFGSFKNNEIFMKKFSAKRIVPNKDSNGLHFFPLKSNKK